MTWMSLGALALPHQLQRHGVALRNEIAKLGVELTTGQAKDPAEHLRGDTGALSALTMRLARLKAYGQNAQMLSARADISQSVLDQLNSAREITASAMLTVSTTSTDEPAITAAGTAALGTLQDVITSLNQRFAGQTLFSGAATDTPPLPDASTVMAIVNPLVAGLQSAQDVVDAVNAAFLDPGGAFETTLYQGAEPAPGGLLETGGQTIEQPTAADPAIRGLLAGLVSAALVAEPSVSLDLGQRRTLARMSSESLLGNASDLNALQAQVGTTQAALEGKLLQYRTESDALTSARQDLVGIDPYEAASRLEEARIQLETLYTVTARTSRLSLTEYLR